MGKAARRQRRAEGSAKVVPAPFVPRPFEGLSGEGDWVALREIVPAATARVRVRADAAAGREAADATVTTILPMAWPALHRQDGEVLVALQSGSAGGDPSRDVASALLAALAADPGEPVTDPGRSVFATPRLQDVLDPDVPFEVTVHEGFDFWVSSGELDEQGRASLERANESVIPTTKLAAAPSAYWCRAGDRTHLRWILTDDEDAVTAGLARLHAAGRLGGVDGLGEGTRFLGAFRACGLLAPVWDLDPALPADAYEEPVAWLAPRLAEAIAADAPLDAQKRRARSGVLSRQLTLR